MIILKRFILAPILSTSLPGSRSACDVMLLFFFYMHPEDLRRPQLNVSNENVQMLCPCFTPVKVSPRSLQGLSMACPRLAREPAKNSVEPGQDFTPFTFPRANRPQ